MLLLSSTVTTGLCSHRQMSASPPAGTNTDDDRLLRKKELYNVLLVPGSPLRIWLSIDSSVWHFHTSTLCAQACVEFGVSGRQ